MNQNNTGTQVIQRTVMILRCFDEQHAERHLGEIVRLTELKPPTAHRILQALVTEGLISSGCQHQSLPIRLRFDKNG